MRMKNSSNDHLFIKELNLKVKPGGEVEIPDAYCIPRKGANTDPMKPIIAMLAPQLVPADASKVGLYKANRLTEGLMSDPEPSPTAADLQAQGMAPAVAELVAAGNATGVPKVQPKPAQGGQAAK